MVMIPDITLQGVSLISESPCVGLVSSDGSQSQKNPTVMFSYVGMHTLDNFIYAPELNWGNCAYQSKQMVEEKWPGEQVSKYLLLIITNTPR